MTSQKIKIAIQKKGRLSDASLDFLRRQGLTFNENGRKLMLPCENRPVDLLLVRDDDIPEYVDRNAAHFGIVGKNVLFEKGSKAKIVKEFNFGFCELVIAVPNDAGISELADLEGMRIATSYPKILRKYLNEQDINAAIIPIKGAVEVAPSLGLADAICDITQTGRTLVENGLTVLTSILKSQAVLISSGSDVFEI